LAIFRDRLPTRRDLALLFAACVFPIQVWSILNVLRELPAWLLRLSSWDLIGVIAYTQAFALLESVLALLLLTLLAVILPARLLPNGLVSHASMAVFVTSAWAVAAHYNDHTIRLWGLREFSLAFLLFLASLALTNLLVSRFGKLAGAIQGLVDRLRLLSFTYVLVDCVSVLIVVVRNS